MDYMEVRARARARARDPRPETPPITCLMPDDKGGEKLTRRRTGGRAADSTGATACYTRSERWEAGNPNCRAIGGLETSKSHSALRI